RGIKRKARQVRAFRFSTLWQTAITVLTFGVRPRSRRSSSSTHAMPPASRKRVDPPLLEFALDAAIAKRDDPDRKPRQALRQVRCGGRPEPQGGAGAGAGVAGPERRGQDHVDADDRGLPAAQLRSRGGVWPRRGA